MLLSSLKEIIPLVLEKIKSLDSKRITLNGVDYFQFSNLSEFREGIRLISNYSIFEIPLQKIQLNPIFSIHADKATLPLDSGAQFQTEVQNIITSLLLTNDILRTIVPDLSPNTIFLKISEPNDLESLKKNVDVFQKIFAPLILHADIDGQIIYEGVEPGSTWIKLNVNSIIAVSLIGSLFWSSVVIYKKFKETQIMDEILKSNKIENKKKETLLEANKILLDIMIDAEAMQLYNNYYNQENPDHEQIERIKHSIKLFSEEISKGAEVNPSLTAPENITNLFPNLKELPTIESKVKKIEQ